MFLLKKFLENELVIADKNIIKKFEEYNKLLLDWNEKINLVSRQTKSIESHILNSVFFLQKLNIPKGSYVIDIGTGGGFPGIPLKILREDLNIVLVDSILKKVKVLEDIIKKLELKKINSVCGRAEELSKKTEYLRKFDIVTAKSVTTLDKLYIWTKIFLKKNGKMIYIKGGDLNEELRLLHKKKKDLMVGVIEFEFNKSYGIQDKKIVIIKE